jgi:hypothetical protein
MRHLIFLLTIYVTLVCPFVCRRCVANSSSQTGAAPKCCCAHCQAGKAATESPVEGEPVQRERCSCPCICNGALRADPVDMPTADLVGVLITLPAIELADVAASFCAAHACEWGMYLHWSGQDRRVTFCSLTC